MKKFSISIPKPCNESWDAMTAEGKGKFCSSCQKTVIDFSEMNDRQLAEFFKKPASSLCGRFMPDQLDKAIIISQKRIPWVRYFFTIAIPAFLFSCKLVGRQALKANVEKTEAQIIGDTIMGVPLLPPPLVAGKVVQMSIDSVIKPRSKKPELKISDVTKCKVKAIVKDSDAFGAVPFEYQPIKIKAASSTSSAAENELQGILGGISISGIKAAKEKPSVPLPEQKKSLSPSSFSVYPNPVSSGSMITLNTKFIEQGSYALSIINTGGSVTQNSTIDIGKGAGQLQLKLKALATGAYFVVLADAKSGKRFTETIIVQ